MGDGSMGRWVIGHWPGAVLQGSSGRLRRTTSPGVRPGQGIQLAQYPVSRIPLSQNPACIPLSRIPYPIIPYPVSLYPACIPLSRIPYPLIPYPVSRIQVSCTAYPRILYRVSCIPHTAYPVFRNLLMGFFAGHFRDQCQGTSASYR
jgi:hypothetical protein